MTSTMSESRVHLSDIQGYSKLAIEAALGATDIVEDMHHTFLKAPLPLGKADAAPSSGIRGLVYNLLQGTSGTVYSAIREVTKVIGSQLEETLDNLHPNQIHSDSSRSRDAIISILNGVLGDHMRDQGNPMTISMSLRHEGKVLELERNALARDIAQPSNKLLVMLHGHCMNELQWCQDGHNHGEILAAANGYTPIYLRYNSGLHISENGRNFSVLLDDLVENWPVPITELNILGYSMGGLVGRSAFHYGAKADHLWQSYVRKMFFVGTPHHGSMLEQAGNVLEKALEISPYSHPLSRLGKIRSAGTTDLRHGNLIDEDRVCQDRFAHTTDKRQFSQLPSGVDCYAISATIAKEHCEIRGRLIGDGLVPLRSALGHHSDKNRSLDIPQEQQRVFYGMNHMQLLESKEVCAQLQEWIEPKTSDR